MKKTLWAALLLTGLAAGMEAKDKPFVLHVGRTIELAYDGKDEQVVQTALEMLNRDCISVFSVPMETDVAKGDIVAGTVGKSLLLRQSGVDFSALKGHTQAFLLQVTAKGQLVIAGSDEAGTAYGLMELSRLMGVSPWEWWADAIPQKKTSFSLPADYRTAQWPSVEYRGIFINDEDFGLLPWSSKHYEPEQGDGVIGPKTNARIFELLLRLRANLYWPAMHACTKPFFLTEGNREVAKKYGIYIGSSHCEPLACNALGEWKERGSGDYDYTTNRTAMLRFWESRVAETANQNMVYTLGLRGLHDGPMLGVSTVEEEKPILEHVIMSQRILLASHISKGITKIPQVFIPYKEVLDVYNAGLKVPDDVTLMWCDDNYGYLRHFPTEAERRRTGGNGVYYHVSYWGRPHDYLWLGTFSPALLYQQMSMAYDHGMQRMWVLNVGDIKPAEYQMELFLDMAWDMDKVRKEGVAGHLRKFMEREFGNGGEQMANLMWEHYRLSYICKPEFLGNTRTEETDKKYSVVSDWPWSLNYIRRRLDSYKRLSDEAEWLSLAVAKNKQDAFFQLVKYPVQATAQMNRKILYGELARHGKADWAFSDAAYDSIQALTKLYNNAHWWGIMNCQPRNLPVFAKLDHETLSTDLPEDVKVPLRWDGSDANGTPCDHLGYEGKAAALNKGEALQFGFDRWQGDNAVVVLHLLPSHAVEGGKLRVSVALDGGNAVVLDYETQGRSEEWKQNVLRNQAIRTVTLPVGRTAHHQLVVTAVDEGVVVDEVEMRPE